MIQILQSPGEWMVPMNRDTPRAEVIGGPSPSSQAADDKGSDKPDDEAESSDANSEPKGDPEMAPQYLRRLLPIFAWVYQSTMLPSVR